MKRYRWLFIIGGAGLGIGLVIWLFYGYKTAQIDSFAKCADAGYPVATSQPPACTAHGHTFLGPNPPPTPSPELITNQTFDLLVEGDSGGTYPQRQEVIRTLADWQRYWRQVHGGLATLPPLLPVDFTAYNVVALSEGRQPTSGYNLKITAIGSSGAGTVIDVTESTPTITCAVIQKPANRYYIVRTPRLPEPVTFRVAHDKHQCP